MAARATGAGRGHGARRAGDDRGRAASSHAPSPSRAAPTARSPYGAGVFSDATCEVGARVKTTWSTCEAGLNDRRAGRRAWPAGEPMRHDAEGQQARARRARPARFHECAEFCWRSPSPFYVTRRASRDSSPPAGVQNWVIGVTDRLMQEPSFGHLRRASASGRRRELRREAGGPELHLGDVVLRLGVRRHPVVLVHRADAGVVRGEPQRDLIARDRAHQSATARRCRPLTSRSNPAAVKMLRLPSPFASTPYWRKTDGRICISPSAPLPDCGFGIEPALHVRHRRHARRGQHARAAPRRRP